MKVAIKMLDARTARAKFADKSNTSWYADIANGVVPAGVPVGLRGKGWNESELDAVLAARAAGWNDDQVRQLVRGLIEERHVRAAELSRFLQPANPAMA
ncbi:helix-turn-helix transcriptional regulator [Variovorax saccharolyticus]|uniref:helix-turn-helix transcriptional regulator n=1 Tax=Variovorax saccharolyticus TaxID=3053516 RepID=UPI002577424D|nr:hypothetical protein [Variovorax sp. J22R187]MDM0018386.1 hypothetical protein [Variovorax sp. J22R187]